MVKPSENEQIPLELINQWGEPLVLENDTFSLNVLFCQDEAFTGAGTSIVSTAQDVSVENKIPREWWQYMREDFLCAGIIEAQDIAPRSKMPNRASNSILRNLLYTSFVGRSFVPIVDRCVLTSKIE